MQKLFLHFGEDQDQRIETQYGDVRASIFSLNPQQLLFYED